MSFRNASPAMVVTRLEDTYPGGSSVRRPASVLDSACVNAPERTGRGPCPLRSAPDSGSSSCFRGERICQTHADSEALNTVMTLNICSLSHTHPSICFIYHWIHYIYEFDHSITNVISISSTYSSHCPSVFLLYSSVSKATALASKATGDGHWLVRWAVSSCLERKSLFFSTVLEETSCKVG